MRWLLITVGGSPEPIIFSITEGKYDRVVFVCTPESVQMVTPAPNPPAGAPDALAAPIPLRAGLHKSRWRLASLVSVDDVSSVFASVRSAINTIRWEDPHPEIDVDFTAGSKSISTGLVLAAIEEGVHSGRLISAMRPDLRSVADGTQVAVPVRLPAVGINQACSEAELLLSKFDYSGAEAILEQAVLAAPDERKAEIKTNIVMCRALDAWNRFDYSRAAAMLGALGPEMQPHAAYVSQLAAARESDAPKFTMLLAADLLQNARRRASTGCFVSAVNLVLEAFAMLTGVTAALDGISTEPAIIAGDPPTAQPGPLLIWNRVIAAHPDKIDARLFASFRNRAALQLDSASSLSSCAEQAAEALFSEMNSVGLLWFCGQYLRILKDRHELLPYPEWPARLLREPRPEQFRS